MEPYLRGTDGYIFLQTVKRVTQSDGREAQRIDFISDHFDSVLRVHCNCDQYDRFLGIIRGHNHQVPWVHVKLTGHSRAVHPDETQHAEKYIRYLSYIPQEDYQLPVNIQERAHAWFGDAVDIVYEPEVIDAVSLTDTSNEITAGAASEASMLMQTAISPSMSAPSHGQEDSSPREIADAEHVDIESHSSPCDMDMADDALVYEGITLPPLEHAQSSQTGMLVSVPPTPLLQNDNFMGIADDSFTHHKVQQTHTNSAQANQPEVQAITSVTVPLPTTEMDTTGDLTPNQEFQQTDQVHEATGQREREFRNYLARVRQVLDAHNERNLYRYQQQLANNAAVNLNPAPLLQTAQIIQPAQYPPRELAYSHAQALSMQSSTALSDLVQAPYLMPQQVPMSNFRLNDFRPTQIPPNTSIPNDLTPGGILATERALLASSYTDPPLNPPTGNSIHDPIIVEQTQSFLSMLRDGTPNLGSQVVSSATSDSASHTAFSSSGMSGVNVIVLDTDNEHNPENDHFNAYLNL